MDFLSLDISNCLTIGSAHIELDNRGLLLIQGDNRDDTSAKSNGAGKSSIVDALCWCLYGETARGESGDVIVNETAGKDCQVIVVLDDGGTKYKIERYRKHSTHKNQLYAFQLAPNPMDPSTPLHKGTEKETQAIVTKIMGCSLDVFQGSIYAGQEKMPDLPGMTDKFLKLLVEEAAGVEELADAYTAAQKLAVAADRAVAQAKAAHESDLREVATAAAALAEAEEQVTFFEAARKDNARAELVKAVPLNAKLAHLTATLAAFDQPALIARKGVLDAELAAVGAERLQMDSLNRVLSTANNAVTNAKNELRAAVTAASSAKLALANVDEAVGTPCGTCGKEYCEADMADVRVRAQVALDAADALVVSRTTTARAAIAAATIAEADVTAHSLGMTDISAASAELATIGTALHEHVRLQGEITNTGTQVANVKAVAIGKMTEINPWIAVQATRATASAVASAETLKTDAAVVAATGKAELIADAVKVFGPAGVRAHILDTVTPFLNDRTGEYLGALADGNIHAVWSTLDKTSKGELKEKFNIAVKNDKGGKTFGLQSGGEKRKVRLSTALALQDMVASRATKPINLFLADEIDDALDAPGLERLMGVLEKKAKERGTVLIISHNSLADWCDQVITVTKSAGKSTVSGSAIRGF